MCPVSFACNDSMAELCRIVLSALRMVLQLTGFLPDGILTHTKYRQKTVASRNDPQSSIPHKTLFRSIHVCNQHVDEGGDVKSNFGQKPRFALGDRTEIIRH